MLTVNITRALAIEGWMSEQELVWLAEQATQHKVIVEIGSYLGRSTIALLDNTPGIVYAIDDWKGPRDVYLAREERSVLFKKFINNVRSAYIEGKLKVLVEDHKAITFNSKPDMVFIDGSHEYEDVKDDIVFWKDKLISCGLICGHDYNFESVSNAVHEILGEVEVMENGTIWYKLCN